MNKTLLIAVLMASALHEGAAQRPPDLAAFDRYVESAARDWNAVGLGVAIVKGDSLAFAKGYGILEVGKAARVDEHTRFAVGSTTKAMTSAAVAMLVDEGKLRWDDKVADHIPGFRLHDAYASSELTIRDLLTHRSGLPGTDLFWAIDENTLPFPEIMKRVRYIRPSSSFRSTFAYQNVMYAIGGTIIERASGMPWDEYIRSRIFAPLGMKESEALVSQIVGKTNVAVPHAEIRDTVRVVPVKSTDAVAPAGSVWSSVSDMSRWMRFMLDSGRVGTTRLISPATFRELVAPQIRAPLATYPALQLAAPHALSYGLGWFVQDYNGKTVWMHTGSIDGMSAIVGLIPEDRMGVCILGNLDHIELRHALMYKAFDLYGSGKTRDWSRDLKALLASQRPARSPGTPAPHVVTARASLSLAMYAGTYADSAYGSVVVSVAGGALNARFEKLNMGVLDHWDYEVFRTRAKTTLDAPTSLTFQTNGSGGVSAVRVYGVSFTRERTTP